MTQVTVKELAQVVDTPVERLLQQMREAGLPHTSAEQAVTDSEKQALLAYLQGSHGAKAEEVGPPVPNQGAFVQPTILTEVGEDNPARYWEFFGPVSMLFRAKDEDDAVRIANDSPYGLSGAVYGTDPDRIARVVAGVRTGTLGVNGGIWYAADAPFGGYKQSGIGREMGVDGFEEYLETKLVAEPAV